MSNQTGMEFRYKIPSPPAPGSTLIELTAPEAENVLLNNLHSAKGNSLDPMWELARFYSHSKQHEKALDYLRRILALQPGAEEKAGTVLAMGQTMEQVGDYDSAVRYYREAFALEPVRTRTWYFINNNLGFSLNMLGRFSEGERFCRAAIEIDGERPNGFKNLGIALRGQGRFPEAAACFVKATQVDASDPRSLKLLEELLGQQPELGAECKSQLECCREAVEYARWRCAASLRPTVHRGWRKRLLLWRTRFATWKRKLVKGQPGD